MEKEVLACASYMEQKYFFEKEFASLPESIQKEVKEICITMAERLGVSFLIGFHRTGEIYFEIVTPTDAFDFDDIGAELEIKALRKEKKELIKALTMWFLIFKKGKELG